MDGKAGFALMAVAAALGISMGACQKQEEDTSADVAREMCGRMLEITRAYTDSMRNARDAAHAASLDQKLQDALGTIAMQYPPETDVNIPEGAMDTLVMATERFAALRREAIARIDTLQSDAADSIPLPTPAQ